MGFKKFTIVNLRPSRTVRTSNKSHAGRALPMPWSHQGCSSSHSATRSASSAFFPDSAKLLLCRKSWRTWLTLVTQRGEQCGSTPSFGQRATDAGGGDVVSRSKRSTLGACNTHLHQSTGFVTTAHLCLGYADILHIFTFESASRRPRLRSWPKIIRAGTYRLAFRTRLNDDRIGALV